MGWNTTVVIRNDDLSKIEDDPDFGKKLVEAIRQRVAGKRPTFVLGGVACVVESHHADEYEVVVVGENLGKVLYGKAREKALEDFSMLKE